MSSFLILLVLNSDHLLFLCRVSVFHLHASGTQLHFARHARVKNQFLHNLVLIPTYYGLFALVYQNRTLCGGCRHRHVFRIIFLVLSFSLRSLVVARKIQYCCFLKMHRRHLIQIFSEQNKSSYTTSSSQRHQQRTFQIGVMMKSYSSLLLLLSCYCVVIGMSNAFTTPKLPQQQPQQPQRVVATTKTQLNNDKNGGGFPNPFKEVSDMFSSLDDVIDDFFNKRMGNGEIFYGKRKYKPSGEVEGDYNGFGLSDKQRIDDTREYRAYRTEEMRRKREEREQQQQK